MPSAVSVTNKRLEQKHPRCPDHIAARVWWNARRPGEETTRKGEGGNPSMVRVVKTLHGVCQDPLRLAGRNASMISPRAPVALAL